VDFIEHLDELGILFYLAIIFVYIAYLRIEFISAFISVCCGFPLAIEAELENICFWWKWNQIPSIII
jgi:hypothetical protein